MVETSAGHELAETLSRDRLACRCGPGHYDRGYHIHPLTLLLVANLLDQRPKQNLYSFRRRLRADCPAPVCARHWY